MQFAAKALEREHEMAKRFYVFMGKNLANILIEISALTNKELLPFNPKYNVNEEDIIEEKKNEEPEDVDPQMRLEESFQQIFTLDTDEVLISREFTF